MFSMRRRNLIGLDIGSSYIKIAELQKGKTQYILKKFGMIKIPDDLIVKENIIDIDKIAEKIRTLFQTHKIKNKNVALSIGGTSVIVKTISVPTVTEKQLPTSIRKEAEQYLPYDLDQINIDSQILKINEYTPDQMDVLLVAVKKDLVAQYIKLIHLAKLNPCVIDVDTFALQNLYQQTYPQDTQEVILLIDVGESKISLNILQGSESLMIRDISCGIYQIKEAKSQESVGQNVQSLSSEQKVIFQWCKEILKIIKTYTLKSSDYEIKKIIVCGGGAYINGFIDALKKTIGIDVSVINPFDKISFNEKQVSLSKLTQLAPFISIAMGLALRKLNDK